jgi:pyruvate carboxylase subunit B
VGREPAIDVRPADLLDPELDRLRAEIGDLAVSDEDVLTYAMFSDAGRKFLEDRAAGALVPEPLLPPPGTTSRPVASEGVATEFEVTVHGETYRVDITGIGIKPDGTRRFFVSLDGMPEEVVVEPLNEFVSSQQPGHREQATGEGHVSTAMPGNILEVLVHEGDSVRAGQPLLITEAMKMQSEIQAPVSGRVTHIYVQRGDRVTPGELLIEIEPAEV